MRTTLLTIGMLLASSFQGSALIAEVGKPCEPTISIAFENQSDFKREFAIFDRTAEKEIQLELKPGEERILKFCASRPGTAQVYWQAKGEEKGPPYVSIERADGSRVALKDPLSGSAFVEVGFEDIGDAEALMEYIAGMELGLAAFSFAAAEAPPISVPAIKAEAASANLNLMMQAKLAAQNQRITELLEELTNKECGGS